MKKYLLTLSLAIYLTGLTGCNHSVSSGTLNNSAPVPPTNANSAATQTPSVTQPQGPQTPVDASQKQAPGVSKDSPPGLLQGTYAIAEVQHDGIVDMIKADTTTEIVFKPPVSFSRLAKKGGKVYHTDSGQYTIAGDTLTLQIILSDEKIQQPPVKKSHKFSISPDGSEFKLTSDKNKTAVFRRISQ